MTLGEKLRHMREVRGMTMADLADQAGMAISSISVLESGNVTDPRISSLAKLARALRVDVGYFLDADVRTPLQLTDQLPEELRRFVTEISSMPYLRLSEKAKRLGIPAEGIESIIAALHDAMNSQK